MAKRLADIGSGGNLVIVEAVTALPFPPALGDVVLVPAGWNNGTGVVPELDLHFRAAGTVDLTTPIIYQGRQFSVALDAADLDDSDVDFSTSEFSKTAHGYLTGDYGFTAAADEGDALLTGLAVDTPYFVIKIDDDTFQLASSLANAFAGTEIEVDIPLRAELDLGTLAAGNIDHIVEAIDPGVAGEDITIDVVFDGVGAGSLTELLTAVTLHVQNNVTTNANITTLLGTSTLLRQKTAPSNPAYVVQSATDNFAATALVIASGTLGFTLTAEDAKRFYWSSLGAIGTIELAEQVSATITIDHRPSALAYYVGAAFSDTVEVTIEAEPIVEQGG